MDDQFPAISSPDINQVNEVWVEYASAVTKTDVVISLLARRAIHGVPHRTKGVAFLRSKAKSKRYLTSSRHAHSARDSPLPNVRASGPALITVRLSLGARWVGIQTHVPLTFWGFWLIRQLLWRHFHFAKEVRRLC